MQVGTTKDQGLYNKPSAAVHPGALAAGTLAQYNTVSPRTRQLLTCTIISVFVSLCMCVYDETFFSKTRMNELKSVHLLWIIIFK